MNLTPNVASVSLLLTSISHGFKLSSIIMSYLQMYNVKRIQDNVSVRDLSRIGIFNAH